MNATDPAAADEQVERALDELMRATDAFVISCTTALRRFAEEPAAVRQLRAAHDAILTREADAPVAPTVATAPIPQRHPLWDRYLDG